MSRADLPPPACEWPKKHKQPCWCARPFGRNGVARSRDSPPPAPAQLPLEPPPAVDRTRETSRYLAALTSSRTPRDPRTRLYQRLRAQGVAREDAERIVDATEFETPEPERFP